MEVQDWIESSIRAFFCFTGIIGNFWLGIRSWPKTRSQLRPNDILFINLAVSNLITNCLVDLPDTMANFVKFAMGKSYCDMIQFSSDLSETSSIFSTMFISIYWHQKLVGSVRRGGAPVQMDNLRLVGILLGGSWTVSLVFSIPHFFIAENNRNESSEVCDERFPTPAYKRTFDGLYLILANAIPLVGVTYACAQIVLMLLQSQKRIKGHSKETKSGANPPPAFVDAGNFTSGTQAKTSNAVNNSSSSNQVRAAKSVVAVATIFLICWFTHLVLRIYSNFRNSNLAVKLTYFIGATYTCFVPYVYLHGVKKLNCSCW
ncbi:alpha-1D adrenergic receptor [Xyrauchen texanus]|uniref:alpha-1D adrenergic receptor n=1 Tax=Xyrauchen texanus TaxID=154827 RepID=UPI002241FFD4|nr:alpha-1D adrenergic receptor [Xyrauchen texanus]